MALHPRVALRPEPFGALAYHYDTRRLVFLKDRELVRVVHILGASASVDSALDACGVTGSRRAALIQAVDSLLEADMLYDRTR